MIYQIVLLNEVVDIEIESKKGLRIIQKEGLINFYDEAEERAIFLVNQDLFKYMKRKGPKESVAKDNPSRQ